MTCISDMVLISNKKLQHVTFYHQLMLQIYSVVLFIIVLGEAAQSLLTSLAVNVKVTHSETFLAFKKINSNLLRIHV